MRSRNYKRTQNENVYAHVFEGDRFDTGNIRGYLDATIEFALRDESLKDYTLEIMREKLNRYNS